MLSEDQITRLRGLYGDNSAAQAILDHFAERERNRSEVAVDRLMVLDDAHGAKLSRGSVIKVLRDLESIALGQLIEGRHGHKSRFRWASGIGMVGVGRVASGEAPATEEELTADDESDDSDDLVMDAEATDHILPQAASAGGSSLEHAFKLRRDFTVKLLLPETLTCAEAARLADFVKSLPFT